MSFVEVLDGKRIRFFHSTTGGYVTSICTIKVPTTSPFHLEILILKSRDYPFIRKSQDNQKPLPVTGAEMALLREHNQLDLALYKRAQELSEFDFEYFRLVQLLIEKGQLQLPTTEAASDLSRNVVPPEHRWKLRPQSAKDPGVKCLRSCGYICHVDFPEETSK